MDQHIPSRLNEEDLRLEQRQPAIDDEPFGASKLSSLFLVNIGLEFAPGDEKVPHQISSVVRFFRGDGVLSSGSTHRCLLDLTHVSRPLSPAPQSLSFSRIERILITSPLFMTGGVLSITLIGAPLGIPLFASGLGLMLSSKPCPS